MSGEPREKTKDAADRALDEAGKESFPASDPPANSGITGVGKRGDAKPDAVRPASTEDKDKARKR